MGQCLCQSRALPSLPLWRAKSEKPYRCEHILWHETCAQVETWIWQSKSSQLSQFPRHAVGVMACFKSSRGRREGRCRPKFQGLHRHVSSSANINSPSMPESLAFSPRPRQKHPTHLANSSFQPLFQLLECIARVAPSTKLQPKNIASPPPPRRAARNKCCWQYSPLQPRHGLASPACQVG